MDDNIAATASAVNDDDDGDAEMEVEEEVVEESSTLSRPPAIPQRISVSRIGFSSFENVLGAAAKDITYAPSFVSEASGGETEEVDVEVEDV